MTVRYLLGDTRDLVASLPAGSVDLVLTSPPFLALRSYLPADHPDKALEIGSEPDPAAFLDTLLDLTEGWGRVLAPHGSICVELGDTYSGSGGAGGDYNEGGLRDGQERFDGSASKAFGTGAAPRPARANRGGQNGRASMVAGATGGHHAGGVGWPLAKSLCLIPSLYAASLAYGRNLLNPDHTFQPWRVRNLVAWVRPNPPVGALGDKVRPATSYLTWATRAKDRWFDLDAVRSEPSPNTHARVAKGAGGRFDLPSQQRDGNWSTLEQNDDENPAGAPPLDWWCIPPGGYDGSHYAVFPEELLRIPIEASCPRRVCRSCGKPSRRIVEAQRAGDKDDTGRDAEANGACIGMDLPPERGWEYDRTTTGWTTCGCPGTDGIRLDGYHDGTGWRPGLVLDPFAGTGTTGVVAAGRSRDALLVDLDERNLDLARQRLGMFLEESVAALR